MTPIQLTDLRVVERYNRDTASGMNKTRYASESDLLSVLTDEALLGELVKRGVLRRVIHKTEGGCWCGVRHPVTPTAQRQRYVTAWEPVGSVSEGEG